MSNPFVAESDDEAHDSDGFLRHASQQQQACVTRLAALFTACRSRPASVSLVQAELHKQNASLDVLHASVTRLGSMGRAISAELSEQKR
jgi:hypothetical protein